MTKASSFLVVGLRRRAAFDVGAHFLECHFDVTHERRVCGSQWRLDRLDVVEVDGQERRASRFAITAHEERAHLAKPGARSQHHCVRAHGVQRYRVVGGAKAQVGQRGFGLTRADPGAREIGSQLVVTLGRELGEPEHARCAGAVGGGRMIELAHVERDVPPLFFG